MDKATHADDASTMGPAQQRQQLCGQREVPLIIRSELELKVIGANPTVG
jgi:hypothetical protein